MSMESNERIKLSVVGARSDALLSVARPGVERVVDEDALGGLLGRTGEMARLGAEGDDVKLDWVDGVEKALAHPEWLAAVEREAEEILRLGIRHIIWAGMGGSVQAVYALVRMGLFKGSPINLYPLDSTDPATLSLILEEIAQLEGVSLSAGPNALTHILEKTMMLGVSMGMTSEEPITHLMWFDDLLQSQGILDSASHIGVMTLPGSYLDDFARTRKARMTPIQLDSQNHTAGRMSAPATRVFLRPIALRLVADELAENAKWKSDGSLIRAVLERAQKLSGLSRQMSDAERSGFAATDPFTALGAALSALAKEGKNKLVVYSTPTFDGLLPWLEQLVEESLGKGGKGLLIFHGQSFSDGQLGISEFGTDSTPLVIAEKSPTGEISAEAKALIAQVESSGKPGFVLEAPLEKSATAKVDAPLGELGALCLGFERMVAVFGLLQEIVFAGQPAVEGYKRYARELRESGEPITFDTSDPASAAFGSLRLYYRSPIKSGKVTPEQVGSGAAAAALAKIIRLASEAGWLRYLDITFNGELTPKARATLLRARESLAYRALGMPAKIRTGPSDYHSTEQSETDGPDELISIRIVALEHEKVITGKYSDRFLLAQAQGTWQAMEDAGRSVVLLTLPRLDSTGLAEIQRFFAAVEDNLGVI